MGAPRLNKGEKVILKSQGSLYYRTSWYQGHLYLTDRRLLFINVTKQIFETGLDGIIELSIVKKAWLFGVRVKQLYVTFNCGREHGQTYIALAEPQKWIDIIKENMTLMLAERCEYNGTNTEPTNNT